MVKKLQEAVRLERYKLDAETEGALTVAEKNDTRLYHPAHNAQTGGALPSIFLAQLQYWWHHKWPSHEPRTPFYKFIRPASGHGLYHSGESWEEELGIGKTALNSYCNNLGRKLKSDEYTHWQDALAEANRQELEGANPVYFLYWTRRSDNLTFWVFNDGAYLRMRLRAYSIETKLHPDADIAKPNADVDNPDTELDRPDAEALLPPPDFPNNRDYAETTQRLHREVEEVAALDINRNGKNFSTPSTPDINSLSREELLVEIAKLPNKRLYDVILEAWGRPDSEPTLSIKDRKRVLEAVTQIHQMGYADDGLTITVPTDDGARFQPQFSFVDWWFDHSRLGTMKGEPPNTPQTIVENWKDYETFCYNIFP